MEINSKFNILTVSLLIIFTIIGVGCAIFSGVNFRFSDDLGRSIFSIFITIAFLNIISMIIFGELRTKAIKVTFLQDSVIKISFFGTGKETRYLYSDITGYKLTKISSRSGSYEYLYLMHNSKKVIKLSEFYHENYEILKMRVIEKHIQYLGYEKTNFFTEIRDRFS